MEFIEAPRLRNVFCATLTNGEMALVGFGDWEDMVRVQEQISEETKPFILRQPKGEAVCNVLGEASGPLILTADKFGAGSEFYRRQDRKKYLKMRAQLRASVGENDLAEFDKETNESEYVLQRLQDTEAIWVKNGEYMMRMEYKTLFQRDDNGRTYIGLLLV